MAFTVAAEVYRTIYPASFRCHWSSIELGYCCDVEHNNDGLEWSDATSAASKSVVNSSPGLRLQPLGSCAHHLQEGERMTWMLLVAQQ